MVQGSDYDTFMDVGLDLDEAGVERGGEASTVIEDAAVRLLLRENRMALAKGPVVRVASATDAAAHLACFDVPLTCVVHSHPECRFRWCRLVVDLGVTTGALVRDMAPREVRSDKPVELKTTVGATLKFEVAPKVLSGEVSPKVSTSKTVYYPEIVSSGVGFAVAFWDFLALSSDYLHADRELRLLISAPEGPLYARFRLAAKVKLAGIAGLIPLLARSTEISQTYRLA